MTSYSVKDRIRLAIIGPPVKTRRPTTQGARNSQAQRVSWRLMPLARARRPVAGGATALPARGLVERGLGLALGPLQGRGRLQLPGQAFWNSAAAGDGGVAKATSWTPSTVWTASSNLALPLGL